MVPNTASTRFRAGPGLWPRSARFANFNRTGFNCFWGRRISDIARCLSPPISRCFDRLLCRRGFRIFRARIRWRGCMGQQLLDSAGLNAVGELYDEGNNHYYLVAKPPGTGPAYKNVSPIDQNRKTIPDENLKWFCDLLANCGIN